MEIQLQGVFCEPIVPLFKEQERIDEALYGMRCEIQNCDKDWIFVRTYYGYEGYVKKNQVLLTRDANGLDTFYQRFFVGALFADILDAPKVSGGILLCVPRGAVLLADSNEDNMVNGYCKVLLYDGRTGYIKIDHLRPYLEHAVGKNREAIMENIIEDAKSYTGVSYRWGGKTPLGIDCSGLTSMACLLNGVIIYRDAVIKEGFCVTEVSLEQMERGDLLYFTGHTALYLGDGDYIYATAANGSDMVVINSLHSENAFFRQDLKESLIAVGRIIESGIPMQDTLLNGKFYETSI